MGPVLRVPALAPFPRCPDRRCGQAWTHAETGGPIRGILKCVRSSCRQRWTIEPLDAGSVRAQLEQQYEDVAIAADVMRRFRLPERIDQPMYLQMPIDSQLWSDYVNDKGRSPRHRMVSLVRRILNVA